MDENPKDEFEKISQYLLNDHPEKYSNLTFELYEKFLKIDNGELTIDDFSKEEVELLFEMIKSTYKKN